GLRILLLEHLRVLAVDHGLRRIDLAVQEQRHVEGLGHDVDVARFGRVDADLAHRGVELGLVPEAPGPDLLALPVLGLGDVLVLEGDLERARPLEDLRDVDEVRSRFARREHLRHPRDAELRRVRGDDLLGHDVRPTELDLDVETEVLEVTLVECRVEACELRLRDPLKLESHLGQLTAATPGAGGAAAARDREHDGDDRERKRTKTYASHGNLPSRVIGARYDDSAMRAEACHGIATRSIATMIRKNAMLTAEATTIAAQAFANRKNAASVMMN